MKKTFKKYYELAKPGIIYGNLLTAVAGFLFACGLYHFFNSTVFVALIFGTTFIIGSACVFNNYTDRALDKKMERTKKRALVSGEISGKNAITYAVILGLASLFILFSYTNTLTGVLELFGFFSYIVFYGLAKRYTVYGVIVGSLPGAMPIVAGYAAVAGKLDLAAFFLFIILILWQMPHFYGIALHRASEYREAGIPVLPLRKGIRRTQIEMLVYTFLFLIAVLLLTLFDYTGYIYFGIMAAVVAIWVWFAALGFRIDVVNVEDPAIGKWGRKMFLYSLVVIVVFSVMASIGVLLR